MWLARAGLDSRFDIAALTPHRSLSNGLKLHRSGDASYAEVQSFIQRVYGQRYGAQIQHWAPQLVSWWIDGKISAAAGFRSASAAPLFLEHYLPAPVEKCIVTQDTPALQRADIVEVGHLAANQAGAGRRLMLALGGYLAEQSVQWVVATATEELRHLFERMGLAPQVLGQADPSCLSPADQIAWGSYYEHHPMVLAGHVQRSMHRLDTARLSQVNV
jgi:hypothetical protein